MDYQPLPSPPSPTPALCTHTTGTLTDAALRHVSRLSCLTALDVFGCRLTDAGAAVLGGAPALRGLRSLECCGGGITGEGGRGRGGAGEGGRVAIHGMVCIKYEVKCRGEGL